jgi:protein involved in ribonucleotide reduction
MYIDDLIIQSLGLPINTRIRNQEEVLLGDFRWGSKGSNYKFTARASSFISQKNGQKLWRVVGASGDYGFGYSFIPTRNILGKRARKQIFDQIINKYNLQQYL